MKFVQKLKELDAAVDHILSIFNRSVVTSGSLESGVRFQRWREAVKEIRRELDSVRTIANRTDYVPPTLIGVDKFIHWTENLGSPGHPFPDWQRWMVRLESPTANPVLVRVPTTPEPPNPAPSDVPPSDPVSVHKGKGKGIPTPSEKIEKERTVQREMDDEGESEVVGEDVQMDEDTSDQVRGRSKKRARSTSESRPMSTRRKSQSRARQSGTKGGGSKGEGTSALSDAPMTPKPKYSRAQVAARTTPPPDPNACSTCVNRKVVCTWTVGNIPCDPCKKRKIGCGKGNVRRASTARTPKTPAKPQATPTPRTSPRPRTTVPPPAADDAAQPPRKKARISKRTEVPPKEVEASTSSAPQRRVTVVIRPPQPHPKTHAVPPPIRDKVSANAPLPAPPIPPSHHHSPPLEPTPIRPSPVDPSNVSWNRRLHQQNSKFGTDVQSSTDPQMVQIFHRASTDPTDRQTHRPIDVIINLQISRPKMEISLSHFYVLIVPGLPQNFANISPKKGDIAKLLHIVVFSTSESTPMALWQFQTPIEIFKGVYISPLTPATQLFPVPLPSPLIVVVVVITPSL
ncbi:hypothetical protein EDD15DRAFT_2521873 [Pisolithus albus]|nr:hypothetical protein EDD15DRAFT_2521873 [Pisolithus albus]